jgi:hypothetical protein
MEGDVAAAQRLGYLLDLVGAGDATSKLADWIDAADPRPVLLRPDRPADGAPKDARWRVVVNEEVESDA